MSQNLYLSLGVLPVDEGRGRLLCSLARLQDIFLPLLPVLHPVLRNVPVNPAKQEPETT